MIKTKTKTFRLDQIDQLVQRTPTLPQQEENDVRNVYGAPPSLDIIPPLNPKPVDEAITDAGKYMIKMQKKGFVKLQEDIKNPNQIYQSSIMKYNKNKKEKEENIQMQNKTEKILEPYQTFWQTSDIVKKTVKELNELQFENNFENLEVENRFRDQVASFVRVMNHNGMLEQNNKSRTELLNITKLFVDKVKEIRVNLFHNYLSKNALSYYKLNKKQQKEFIEFKPKKKEIVQEKQTQDEGKLDSAFLNRIRQASTNLPRCYQMTNLGFDDSPLSINHVKLQKEMKQLAVSMHSAVDKAPKPILPNFEEETEKNTPRDDQSIPKKHINVIMMPKIIRKCGQSVISNRPPLKPTKKSNNENQNPQSEKSSLPKLTQKQIYNNYWQNQDPLADIRQGFAPNALQMIEKLSQQSNKDYMKLFSTSDNNSNLQSNNTTSDELNQNDLILQTEDQYESDGPIQLDQIQNEKRKARVKADSTTSLRDNIFSTSVLNLKLNDDEIVHNSIPVVTRNYIFDPKSDDIQYLIQQSAELENGDMSQAIYKRLEAIWETLGFSVTQKLQMVIKYSESTEESSKLNSALKFWEEANNSAINYQKAYTALKDFLKYNLEDQNDTTTTMTDLNNNLSESENNLIQVAKTLKSMYGDDLVFHGKKIDDIIKSRRIKLKMLQQHSKSSKESKKS